MSELPRKQMLFFGDGDDYVDRSGACMCFSTVGLPLCHITGCEFVGLGLFACSLRHYFLLFSSRVFV